MSTEKQIKIVDDDITIIHDDLKRIQTRPTQFITAVGSLGVFHLCKEIIDNASDECGNKKSPGNHIQIIMTDKSLIVRDNGRGIATDKIREIYETMQAGSNMTRANGSTKGENGLGGSTCVLATSSYLEVTTIRPNEKKKMTLIYKDAKLESETCEEYTGNDHGLIVTFRPSKRVLGVDTLPVHMIEPWLKDFDFTLSPNIKMDYKINGKEHHVEHKELYKFFDRDLKLNEDKLCSTLVFPIKGDLLETFMDKTYNRTFNAEVAIVYSNPEHYKGEDIWYSWMNMIYTKRNGDHFDGVKRGFIKALTERVYRKNKKLDGEDIKKDIEAHLNIVVNAKCDMAHMFSAQGKDCVLSKDILKGFMEATYNELSKSRNSVLDEMVEIVVGNHRARVEGEKARKISSTSKALKNWVRPDSFIPCSSVKTVEPKELYLVEGLSAGGGIRAARNSKFQAILQFRGKSLNVWNQDLARILKSEPWLNLVKVLGCGIGPTFDIKKLNFDKIILATDADIDGYHIRTGWCSFFMKEMPEIITAGKLYVAEPPLYQLVKGKEKMYVATQTEYIEKCVDSIGDLEISFIR